MKNIFTRIQKIKLQILTITIILTFSDLFAGTFEQFLAYVSTYKKPGLVEQAEITKHLKSYVRNLEIQSGKYDFDPSHANQIERVLPKTYRVYADKFMGNQIKSSRLVAEALLAEIKKNESMFCNNLKASLGRDDQQVDIALEYITQIVNQEQPNRVTPKYKICDYQNKYSGGIKNFIFIVTDEADFKFDSWTWSRPADITFLVFNINKITTYDLALRILHELAISFDNELHFSELQMTAEEQVVFNNPVIQNTFKVIRASRFEQIIFPQHIFLNKISNHKLDKNQNCRSHFLKYLPQALLFFDLYQEDQKQYLNKYSASADSVNYLNVLSDSYLCEELSLPKLSRYIFNSSGPRPRVTSGAGGYVLPEDLKEGQIKDIVLVPDHLAAEKILEKVLNP